ncbi:MAG TPA: glutamyl-tRNA reductase [Candidatus Marinimicrobia bacterium]|nr:glutamyl-tRNA reductase [Candidatus Neomarinimicrobiota bacterium]
MKSYHIILLGWSHENAPIDFRDKLTLNREESESCIRNLRDNESLSEFAILSTCNRTEFYGLSASINNFREIILSYYQKERGLIITEADPSPRFLLDEDAILHLFAVAAGMKSMVLGENQILAQIKSALEILQQQDKKSPVLHRLFQDAIRAGKAVRSETALCEGAVSVSYAAVELGKKIFRNFEKRNILLIGAGETAELTALHFQKNGGKSFMIVNRNLENRNRLANALNGQGYSLEDLPDILPMADVVVTATGSDQYLLNSELLKHALKKRRYAPILLLDISSPRAIDPAIRKIEDLFLYDIDDLQNVVDENLSRRRAELPAAAAVTKKIAGEFAAWWKTLAVVPTISSLNSYFRSIAEQELEKFRNRSNAESLETARLLSNSIIKKLLHHPIQELRKMTNGEVVDFEMIRTVRAIFHLDDIKPDEKERANDSK